jgi:O-antigen ligase
MLSVFVFKDKTKGKFGIIIYYSILCFIVSLFIKDIPVVSNLLMLSIFLLAWVNIPPKQYCPHFLKHPVNIGIIFFFLFHLFSLICSTDKVSGLEVLQKRLPLFILPVAFCLIDFENKTWNKILLFFAISTTVASIIGFSYSSYLAITEHDNGFLYNDNISAILFGKQAIYFAIYINFAVFIFIYQLLQREEIIRKIRFLIWISIPWLLFISYMLACKTAMFSLFIILLWTVTHYLIRKRKFFEIILISFTIVVAIFLAVRMFPKTINRFKGLTQTEYRFDNQNSENHFNAAYDKSKWSSTNTRIALWACGLEVWKEHLIFGTGIGDRDASLYNKYKQKQFWLALSTEKNTHNQYIDIAVSMGILGLFVFLFVFLVYPLRVFLNQKQSLAISVLLCLAVCFFTENMLNRYQGIVLISLMLPLSEKVFDKPEKEIKLNESLPDTY